MAGMLEVIFCAPVAAMHDQHHRKGATSFRNPYFTELVGIRTIRQTGIGGWSRQVVEMIVCRHGSLSYQFPV